MTQPESWPAELSRQIAAEVRHHRQRRGMSAQELADATAALGYPIARSVIANLESGRRSSVLVAELVILAKALGVPPIVLIYPVGRSEKINVLPANEMSPWQALQWFTGETPFDSSRDLFGFVAGDWKPGDEEDDVDDEPWHREWNDPGAAAVDLYRWHERHVRSWKQTMVRASSTLKASNEVPPTRDPALPAALRRIADNEEFSARRLEHYIRDTRRNLRRLGLEPPQLHPLLATRMAERTSIEWSSHEDQD